MLSEIGVNDYLNSLDDIDRASIEIAIKTAQSAYGNKGVKTAMLAFGTMLNGDYKELNIVLGPCDNNPEHVKKFKQDMRFLNTYMRHNFRIDIHNYEGLWILKRLDHEEIDKFPRVEHRPKITMKGVASVNLFLEMEGIILSNIRDSVKLAEYIDRYAILQNDCQQG